jgi:hypothetical protein
VAHGEDEQRRGGADEPFEGGQDERHEHERPQDVRQVVGADQARGQPPPAAVQQVRAAVAGERVQRRDEANDEAAQPERDGNRNAWQHDVNPFPVNDPSSPERGDADIGPWTTPDAPLV